MIGYLSCRGKFLRQSDFSRTAVRLLAGLLLAGVAQFASAAAPSPEINVATYNLRLNTASDGPNAWPQRVDTVKALVRYHEFDILGTQEGLPDQIADLDAMPSAATMARTPASIRRSTIAPRASISNSTATIGSAKRRTSPRKAGMRNAAIASRAGRNSTTA
jgi:hypothetical protein